MSRNLEELLFEVEARRSGDFLNLAHHAQVSEWIDPSEIVLWTDKVLSKSHSLKSQERVLVITNHRLYETLISNLKTTRKSFDLSDLSKITLGDSDDDLILHFGPTCLWYNSKRRFALARLLSRLGNALSMEQIPAELVSSDKLAALVTSEASTPSLLENSKNSVIAGLGMANRIRKLVSKKKKRFKEDGFDLDLSYITPRVIAMGFPSEDLEGLYRNPMIEVQRFLEQRHKNKYKVYNLCSERYYDPSKFHNRVLRVPFDDHNCPSMRQIIDCCKDMHEWTQVDEDNVIAVHCKAGKGRTGLMIACFLVYADKMSADKALEVFASKRTHNGKGVTIPSQKRYVSYFEEYLDKFGRDDSKFPYETGVPLVLTNARISPVPKMCLEKSSVYFTIQGLRGNIIFDSRGDSSICSIVNSVILFACSANIAGNLKISFKVKDDTGNDNDMFHFWFHSYFIKENVLFLSKNNIDKACKDKYHKKFDELFSVELFFRHDDIAALKISEAVQPSVLELCSRLESAERELFAVNAKVRLIEEDIDRLLEENQELCEKTVVLRRKYRMNCKVKQECDQSIALSPSTRRQKAQEMRRSRARKGTGVYSESEDDS